MRGFVILVILNASSLENHCLRNCKAENDLMDPTESKNVLETLEWQIAMGADEAIDNEPQDWFLRSGEQIAANLINSPQQKKQESAPALTKAPAQFPAKSPGTANAVASSQDEVGDARKLAASCKTIDELLTALESFDACPLSRTATNLCFIDGNRQAEILLIGEAPGRDEDIAGKPFVGRSGQLLDKMLSAIDLSRNNERPDDSVLISNTVFWRPPGNRKPTEAETLVCLPFVNKLIELVAPKFIVCLGATPTQRLTGETKGITRLRGRWFDHTISSGTSGNGKKAASVPLLATLHPSYLLRQPMQKKLAWRDFFALKLKVASSNQDTFT